MDIFINAFHCVITVVFCPPGGSLIISQRDHGWWAENLMEKEIYIIWVLIHMNYLSLEMVMMLFIAVILALLAYSLIRLLTTPIKIKEEIKNMFDADEKDGCLVFKYRNYDVIATFKPVVKISVVHNKKTIDIKPPHGATLTPIYLIFKIKKPKEMVEKLDKYMDFLDSIPTQ